jgi:tRNA(Ile)-lysidine synthase
MRLGGSDSISTLKVSLQTEAEQVLARYLDGNEQTPLAVAFSGGSDSLATLILTLDFAARRGRRVLALTLDHGLQEASRQWTQHCAMLAASLGAEPISLIWESERPSADASGLPAAARTARHRLLAREAKAHGAKVLIFGHTQDDQRESDWMRRSEGSTLGRLKAWGPSPVWPEGRGVFLLRPVLNQSREDLRAFLTGKGLGWIEDPANQDPRFGRARARMELANLEAEVPTVMSGSEPIFWPKDLGPWTAYGALVLDREALQEAPQGLESFMARALLSVSGHDAAPRYPSLQRLTSALRDGAPFTATLSGAQVRASPDQVWIIREAGRKGLAPLDLLPMVSSPPVWDGRFQIGGGAAGAQVIALRGQAKRLSPRDRKRLADLPAPLRATLPLVARSDGTVSLPTFMGETCTLNIAADSVILQRLAAACGRIISEQALG